MNESISATPRVRRIEVAVRVGTDRLAASDDPLFLELLGPHGREFRLELAQGKQLRRGGEDRWVLAGADDPETNVAQPALNDPRVPGIDPGQVFAVGLRKGMEPIPNVRGLGEMDDRVQLLSVEILLHVDGEAKPRRFAREGPIWLGLVCGQRITIPRTEP